MEPWDVSGRRLFFGNSVCLDGDLLVVGAPTTPLDPVTASSASGDGEAYLFVQGSSPYPWIPLYGDYEACTVLHAKPDRNARTFGRSVSVSGDNALVGRSVWSGPFSAQGEATFFYNFACDATTSISVSPSPIYDFGSVAQNESAVKTFTISSTGGLDVAIESIVSDSPHFVVKNAPIGQVVPPDATFDVEFLAGNIAGIHSAWITVKGTGATGAVDAEVEVSGTVVP